ncbi:MAG: nitroreductase [Bacteroidetes bacterium]|nr:nitroreductase [Bacteroidota bacterium]
MDSKLLSEIIKNRRATPPRFLGKKEIPKEIIQQLLENANWAPNHKNTEPWRFKVYTGESKQKLAEEVYSLLIEKIESGAKINPQKVDKLKNTLERVPVVIAIILERDAAQRIPEWEELAAVTIAVQNMWLTATAMELGAFWATPKFLPMLNDILELKPGQKSLGFFYVGEIALEYPSPGRGDVEAKVEWKE